MPEVRVTIDENLDSFLDKLVASGLYPSKPEPADSHRFADPQPDSASQPSKNMKTPARCTQFVCKVHHTASTLESNY
jgi:hypothetical protein